MSTGCWQTTWGSNTDASVSPLETLPRYMRKSLGRILIIFSHYRLSRLCWDVLDVSATSWSLLWQLKTGPKNKNLTHFNKRQTLIVTQLSHLQNASLAGVPDLQSVAFAKSGSRRTICTMLWVPAIIGRSPWSFRGHADLCPPSKAPMIGTWASNFPLTSCR